MQNIDTTNFLIQNKTSGKEKSCQAVTSVVLLPKINVFLQHKSKMLIRFSGAFLQLIQIRNQLLVIQTTIVSGRVCLTPNVAGKMELSLAKSFRHALMNTSAEINPRPLPLKTVR